MTERGLQRGSVEQDFGSKQRAVRFHVPFPIDSRRLERESVRALLKKVAKHRPFLDVADVEKVCEMTT